MSQFFGRPQKTGGGIKMGKNICHIKNIEDVTKDYDNQDLALVFTLGFPGSEWTRDFRAYFSFDREQNGKIKAGDQCYAVKRFYERFVDYLGLPIGLNENGKIIHQDGTEVKDVVGLLKSLLELNEDRYMCYVEPDEHKGKVYQNVELLVDARNPTAVQSASGYITWRENRAQKPNGSAQAQEKEDDEQLPPI